MDCHAVMAVLPGHRCGLRWTLAWLLLLLGPAAAQQASPSNDTSTLSGDVGFTLSTMLNNMNINANITPLTNQAGLSGSQSQLQEINPTGPLFLATGDTVTKLQAGDIAYISCEPTDYIGGIDSSRTINLAVNTRPSAIVLYSTFAARCGFDATNDFSYSSLYTMMDANNSSMVAFGLNHAQPPNPMANIHLNPATVNGTGNGSDNNNILGRSPTTAVAMIILYSITGIITALFLIIIVVGAVRAHRHPERYGPRRIAGRPRQSRAKGIARAMLETLPIVKFGDSDEANKPPGQTRDVELAPVAGGEQAEGDGNAPEAHGDSETAERGSQADVVRTESATDESDKPKGTLETGSHAVDSGLACSVCVDDFVKGQDIRVLPCKHTFHPECIDPWLLNVSGTCPLCRVDLRPTTSHGSEAADTVADPLTVVVQAPEASGDGDTGHDDGARRNRRSRVLHLLNIGRMREATPEERIDALRRLRQEGFISANAASTSSRTHRRFSHRLSRAFGSRPASGVPDSRPVSEVPETTNVEHPMGEEHQSSQNSLPEPSASATAAPQAVANEHTAEEQGQSSSSSDPSPETPAQEQPKPESAPESHGASSSSTRP